MTKAVPVGKKSRKVRTGEIWMNLSHDNNPFIQKLTTKEREVVFLRVQGYTRKQIAKALTISDTTAKTHLQNIHRKLGVSTYGELIQLIL